MCDYSLMSLPNRLAVCGEDLVVHRFISGAMGLASPAEVCQVHEKQTTEVPGFFAKIKNFLYPPDDPPCTAVCLPPGAHLLVRNIPESIQRTAGIQSTVEEVVFTQTDTVGFRDTFQFPNGTEILVQRLSEGMRVTVLALSSEEHSELLLHGEVAALPLANDGQ
jgi:hypothetical protein